MHVPDCAVWLGAPCNRQCGEAAGERTRKHSSELSSLLHSDLEIVPQSAIPRRQLGGVL